ncbi:DUF982 domain-containing protein [Rhizobium cauense]|uniref:DUF982 domain-containing protein n=1 Tax=Rhizobium cauense TaxID=1166683 RepID=UPI001C6F1AEB|nr:DUF982 domain-containing protein [Rhizobium cauense]
MFQQVWSRPVSIRLPMGVQIVHTPREATDFLVDVWPFGAGDDYEKALDACQDCYDGRTDAEEVRAALISACRGANALVAL